MSGRHGFRIGAFVVLAASLVAGAVLWFVIGRPRAVAPSRALPVETTTPSVRATTGSSEPSAEPAGTGAKREGLAPTSAQKRPAAEDDSDPPTPERPGPGQALLRVEVVALETGKPLAGARIQLTSDAEDHEWIRSTQSDPARGVENDPLTSNVAGRCEFVVQANFAYTLVGDGEDGLADRAELALEPFREGEEREVRLALVTAWTLDWYGQVIDGETQLPIGGAQVDVLAQFSGKKVADLRVIASGRSGPSGGVVLRLPAWESLSARASAPGYFWGGCRVETKQRTIDSSGTMALRRPAVLDASVIGSDGSPAAGIEVRLHTLPALLLGDTSMLDDVEWRATTDADGRCHFDELPAGLEMDLEVDLLRGERVLLRPERLDFAAGERRSVEWHLQEGCKLTGVVRDSQGHALANTALVVVQIANPLWTLSLRDGDYRSLESWNAEQGLVARVQSDTEGRFELDELGVGSWAIGPPERAKDLPDAQLVFEIAPGQLTKEVELELDRGLSITGVAFDPEGKPAREVGVSCSGKDAPHEHFGARDYPQRDGRFDLGPLLAGDYWVSAGPDEDPLHEVSERVPARTGDRDVVVRLRWAGVLGGTVVDAETGEPAAAIVTGAGSYRASPEDAFEFEQVLPGSYDLVATTKDGRIGVLPAVRVNERERKDQLVIPVRRGATLHSKTQGPYAFFRLEVEWEGIVLGSESGDLEAFIVPAGHVVVRWFRLDKQGGETLEHEEDRTVALGQQLTLEVDLR